MFINVDEQDMFTAFTAFTTFRCSVFSFTKGVRESRVNIMAQLFEWEKSFYIIREFFNILVEDANSDSEPRYNWIRNAMNHSPWRFEYLIVGWLSWMETKVAAVLRFAYSHTPTNTVISANAIFHEVMSLFLSGTVEDDVLARLAASPPTYRFPTATASLTKDWTKANRIFRGMTNVSEEKIREELKKEFDELQAEVEADLKAELAEAQKDLEAKGKEVDVLEEKISQMEEKVDDLADVEQKAKDLESALATARNTIHDHMSELDVIKARHAAEVAATAKRHAKDIEVAVKKVQT